MEDKAFYKSTAWKKCRAAYIKKCGGLCERCLAQGLIKPGYIVHHKTHLTEENVTNPDIALSFDNLEYLCMDCHNAEHFTSKDKRYRIAVDGSVMIV